MTLDTEQCYQNKNKASLSFLLSGLMCVISERCPATCYMLTDYTGLVIHHLLGSKQINNDSARVSEKLNQHTMKERML